MLPSCWPRLRVLVIRVMVAVIEEMSLVGDWDGVEFGGVGEV